MASSPDRGKPKPRCLKKRNFHTEAANSHPVGQEKMNSQGKRGPCLKARRHQDRTPYFSSSVRQPNPISIQRDKNKQTNKNKNKAHATHSHALVGNWEKFICVNRSNREQQNPPACSQDTLESGMSQSIREQSKGREDALAGKGAGQCREGIL